MPLLPQPPPPAAIPGFATTWVHAFSGEAYSESLSWLRKMLHCCNKFLSGVVGDALWRLMPRSMAFGIEHFQPPSTDLAGAQGVLGRFGTWYLRVFPVVIQHIHSYEHQRPRSLPITPPRYTHERLRARCTRTAAEDSTQRTRHDHG